MKKAFVTVDLGFGDAGKGATVDWLCREHRDGVVLVVRYSGGAQAAHNVVLPNGTRHVFAQFGAGHFSEALTFLGPEVIIKPIGIKREAQVLSQIPINGVKHDPYMRLTVHPDSLVATSYHQALNRIREACRYTGVHGSCGIGIGETRSYWLKYGQDAIFAKDLADKATLDQKLNLLRQRFLLEIHETYLGAPDKEMAVFLDLSRYEVRNSLLEDSKRLRITDEMPSHKVAVYEAAQGVLLDEHYGFYPHNTWSTTTVKPALDLVNSENYDELKVLGITRAYQVRHGAGPLPTYDPRFNAVDVEIGNPHNTWQGSVRGGWLDFPLLDYAIKNCGFPLDGLVVNHLDHLQKLGDPLFYASGYDAAPHMNLNDSRREFLFPNKPRQELLGKQLKTARPILHSTTVPELLSKLNEKVPIYATANGTTHLNRSYYNP